MCVCVCVLAFVCVRAFAYVPVGMQVYTAVLTYMSHEPLHKAEGPHYPVLHC